MALRKSKYRSVRTIVDGISFHSKMEASRYKRLKAEQELGFISDLELQKPYPCIVNDQLICTYYADFFYFRRNTNEWITEDVKGARTAIYRIKKKLVEALYGIVILETGGGKYG